METEAMKLSIVIICWNDLRVIRDCLRSIYEGTHATNFEVVVSAHGSVRGYTERSIDWQSGCCVMFGGNLLKRLGGFDEQFFYHFEEVDLCRRVWNAGYPILFTPEALITHLGGQSVGRFPVRFEIEKHRSRYRYFYKHFGAKAARNCRRLSIVKIRVRQLRYGLLNVLRPAEILQRRMEFDPVAVCWDKAIEPPGFVEPGEKTWPAHTP